MRKQERSDYLNLNVQRIMRISHRMHQAGRVPWIVAGLNKGAFTALCALDEAGEPDGELTVSELTALLKISKAGVSQLLRTLESDGLVERHPRSTDRRVVGVRLTPAGRDMVHQAKESLETVMAQVLDAMGEQDAEQLSVLLERFCDLLESAEAQQVRGRKEENCVDI